MQKLTAGDPDTQSTDLISEHIEGLRALFPEAFTEGKVDFEVLRELLGDAVDDGDEKYGLNWRGKRAARRLALTPSTGTLRPVPEDSVDWDTTQNLMIEGDNLEVLKLLQKSYAGKVDLIYIDPPYNTGTDRLYPDSFQNGVRRYLEITGQIEGDGTRLSTNTETSGRYHTDWLMMMYPRLRLGRDLLRPEGLIFISIDDNEVENLRALCDEVFGEENFVNQIAVKSSETSGVKMSHVDRRLPKIKEYLVAYSRTPGAHELSPIRVPKSSSDTGALDSYLKYYSSIVENPDEPVDTWRITTVAAAMKAEGLPLTDESTRDYKLANADRVVYRTNNAGLAKMSFDTPTAEVTSATGLRYVWWEGKQMLFLSDHLEESLCDLWTDISTINTNKEMLGLNAFADGQKPIALIDRCLQLASPAGSRSIVVDFFAGSGTAGHAVMLRNCADSGARRFILVQLPEPLDEHNGDHAAAIEDCDRLGKPRTIAEITKERLRRASSTIRKEHPEFTGDLGFRVFKLDSSNIREWEPDRENVAGTLDAAVANLKADRTEDDILYELVLKRGIELTVPAEEREIAGKTVHSIGAGTLLVCLAPRIERSEAEPLALGIVAWYSELAPAGDTRVIFRDSAFVDDVAKTNVAEILKQHGLTDVKSI